MSDADAIIAALRTGHDRLAELVPGLSDDDLARTSGAADWDVAQVLSHLGSGAEIGLATLRSAADGGEPLSQDQIHAIWDRWNAMPRREQAESFVPANAALTERYEALGPEQRENLRINLGFLPAPVDVATAGHLRLSELTLHAWDIDVAFDAGATLPTDASAALLPRSGMLIAWLAKSEPLAGRDVVVAVTATEPEADLTLTLGGQPGLSPGVDPAADATLRLSAEAWLRLTSGRLPAERTPESVEVSGSIDLEVLREVFPGY